MTASSKVFAIALFAGVSACGGGGDAEITAPDAPVEAVAAPDGGDWSEVVTVTPAGGHLMGNPDAPVKLIEYGSTTCPHCANFELNGAEPLVENYVKSGRVSWEYRNYVFNVVDMTATLIARCTAPENYFAMQHALFAAQSDWAAKGYEYAQTNQQLGQMKPEDQFRAIADAAGLKTFAAQRGLSPAAVDKCLAEPGAPDKLVAMTQSAAEDYGATGTPAMIVNGKLQAEVGERWDRLEPILKTALGDK